MRCIVMSPVFSTTMQLRQSLPAGISLIRHEFHQQFSIRYVPLRRILTMRGLVPSYWNAIPASSPDSAGRSAFGVGNVS